MSPQRDKGAVPSADMAILESDVHHLRDQSDRDRRAVSERLVELRDWRARIESMLAALGTSVTRLQDSTTRLEKDGLAQTQVLQGLTTTMLEQRGVLRFLKWLIPAGVVADIALRLWGHK